VRDPEHALRTRDLHPAPEWQRETAVEAARAAARELQHAARPQVDSIFERSRRPDALGLRVHGPADAEDWVAAHVEQAAAARLGVQANVRRVEVKLEGKRRIHVPYLADHAVVDPVADRLRARMVRPHEAVHKPHAFRLAGIDEYSCFVGGTAEG